MPAQDFFHRYLFALADIHGSLNLETAKDAVVRNAALLFGARGASLMLFEPGGDALKASASFGLSEAYRAKGAISPKVSLGETIQRAPVVVRDVASDPNVQYREAAIQEGIKSIVGLPLKVGGTLAGSLRLYFAQPQSFSLEEMDYLQALATQSGLALRKAFYFAAIHAAVSEIHRLPSLDSLKSALKQLVKSAAEYGHARGCALLLKGLTSGNLESVISYGLSDRYLAKGPLAVGLSLGEVGTGEPVIISDTQSDARVQYKKEAENESVRAIIGLPVWVGRDIVGALRLYYSHEFKPDEDDLMWMEFLAHHAGMAIEKNQMLIQLKDKHDWYKDVLQELDSPLYR